MKLLARSVLSMEILLIGFALLLAKDLESKAGLNFGYLTLALTILALATLRKSMGWILGWAVQIALIGYGFYIPSMFFMGALFLALWVGAIVVGRKGEAIRKAGRGHDPE
jgi:hypothetical protein